LRELGRKESKQEIWKGESDGHQETEAAVGSEEGFIQRKSKK
jgi:hypothetical protein